MKQNKIKITHVPHIAISILKYNSGEDEIGESIFLNVSVRCSTILLTYNVEEQLLTYDTSHFCHKVKNERTIQRRDFRISMIEHEP